MVIGPGNNIANISTSLAASQEHQSWRFGDGVGGRRVELELELKLKLELELEPLERSSSCSDRYCYCYCRGPASAGWSSSSWLQIWCEAALSRPFFFSFIDRAQWCETKRI